MFEILKESSMTLFDHYFSYRSAETVWNYKVFCFSGAIFIAYFWINTFYLIRTKNRSDKKPFQLQSFFYQVDRLAKFEFFALLLVGLTYLGYPVKMLNAV